ncbi:LacI family DNA-binding transcriptional regulator [Pontivivens insulae]|uniref:Catabolite control protein A n=1 Tax=Pontivivens insulae TaxID=1639689 RepID=A0A2R8AE15_9RHOB|nr:LacI family DNA-binding transcriptional regulator [Pontivivens insulae]RED14423.1 LacI family transcriptional regulator [Pontivivens insulae]SPF30501.1 Catabolite control protein A [Pontivivens insulae]
MERRPTIIDVARHSGVSKSTVSLVLQNSPAVKAETRAQVCRSMEEIGYVYNRAAATLRSSTTGLVGLVINDLRNPFFAEFATSLQMALSERGLAAVVANTDENIGTQEQMIGAMIEHGVAAVIVSPAYGEGHGGFDALERAGIPTMQVLRRGDARTDLFPFASPDYQEGGRRATEHLIEMGARRIAFAGGLPERAVTLRRMQGYREVLADAGLPELILTGRSTRAFGRELGARLPQDHPEVDGVVCFNDLVALGMLSGCHEVGRRIGPEGLRVVGFDDIEECAQVWPPLSSVRCDIAQFGEKIAHVVLDRIGAGVWPYSEWFSPVSLRLRASSTSS